MTPHEETMHMRATQVILNNKVLTLLGSMTPEKSIDELNTIRSEADRKEALIDLLEQEIKAKA